MGDEVLNPHQLQLFMSGTELKSQITTSMDASMGTRGMEGLWPLKLKESKRVAEPGRHGSGIYKSIESKGWVSDDPNYGHVNMSHGSKRGAIPAWNKVERDVDDAHHRIAAAADIEARSMQGGLKGGKEGPNLPVAHHIPVTHWEAAFNQPLTPHSTRDPLYGRD
jgi:hypothetical protein